MDDYSPFLNYWLYPRYLAAPLILLCFNAAPCKDGCDRTWRLLAAFVITGTAIVLAELHESSVLFDIYHTCLEGYTDSNEGKTACQSLKDRIWYRGGLRQKGGLMWAVLIFGAGYVGMFDVLWRIRFRKQLKQLGTSFKGRCLSNLFILVFICSAMLISHIYYTLFFIIRGN